MNHDEWLARADVYALDALDGQELREFEAHLAAGCEPCEAHLRETREALTLLPRSLAPVTPPPEIKSRLLTQIAPRADHRETSPGPRWLWWGMGAGAVAAAGLIIVLSWSLVSTRQALDRLEGQVAGMQTALAERDDALRLLSDPRVRFVGLAGLPPSPDASAQVVWDPVTREGFLLTTRLPVAPSDKAYELWAIAGNEPVPAGVFRVDRAGRALLRLPHLPEGKTFDKFAVTLEPAAGVQKPSGPMHLLGSV
jgi:anti-sigma-K factor RskA